MTPSLIPLLSATLRPWAPLALVAMGGVLSERAGVANIALEGMMLSGCFAAVAGAQATHSATLGVVAGFCVGAFVGLLHAIFTQAGRVPHILSGVAINLGALGLTTYLLRNRPDATLETTNILPAEIAVPLAIACVVALYFVLSRTPLGLRLRAAGENPAAARSAGVNVPLLRYGAVILSGGLAGLGGATLALVGLGAFEQNMTAGRGYIALAAVIFGRWSPLGAALAALFFAAGDVAQQSLQTQGLKVPPDFVTLLPYVLTLLALAFAQNRSVAPGALGKED